MLGALCTAEISPLTDLPHGYRAEISLLTDLPHGYRAEIVSPAEFSDIDYAFLFLSSIWVGYLAF